MYKFVLKAIIPLILFVGYIGCKDKTDDQLKRFLHNDNIEFDFSIDVDSSSNWIYIASEGKDTVVKKTYSYPGIIILDNKFVFLNSQGGALTPQITIPGSQFEGAHRLKLMFSDDMLYKDEQLTSKNKDSLEVFFSADFLGINEPVTVTKDSVIITSDRDLPSYKAVFGPMAVNESGIPISDKGLIRIETDLKNGRAAFAVSQFVKEGYKDYYSRVWFLKELPLMYKGKKKGNFRYNYMVKDIRFKLK